MKILTLESGFPPELASGRLPHEFACELAKRGHEVTVITIFPRKYLAKEEIKVAQWRIFYREHVKGVDIIRFRPQFSSNSLFMRMLEQIVIPLSLFIGGIIAVRKNMVLHCTIPPLLIGVSACIIGKSWGIPVVVRIQDVHPDALVKLGLLRNRFLTKILELVEKFVYSCGDHLTVIGESYRRHVVSKGISPDKVTLIPNWADTTKISFSNNLTKFPFEQRLHGRFIVTYAGTISWPQDLETIVEAANMLKEYEDTAFLLVGDGAKKGFLIERSKTLGLNNIRFLPLQPREKYFEILKSSNACLVSLRKTFKSPSVPSKILDIMACARPIIANVPLDGDIPCILEKAKCGLAVEPENPQLLSQAIIALHNDRTLAEELGKNGREYLERHFSLPACINRYEEIMTKLFNES